MNSAVEARVLRIVLADDHDLVRSGVRALLRPSDGLLVVGEARNAQELLGLIPVLQPDVAVMDISMPGMDAFAAMDLLRRQYPEVRLLIVSMHDSADVVRRAVASGARGFVAKSAAPEELVHALRAIAVTGSYFSASVARRLLAPARPAHDDDLTERQIQILILVARGMSAKAIASELGLSPKTVDVHRARIMERLRLNDVASLTRYALRKGLLQA